MIKKFKEFNEDLFPISMEEIEDQLLRLEEVFGCYINYYTTTIYSKENPKYGIHIYPVTYYRQLIITPYDLPSGSHQKALDYSLSWTIKDEKEYDENVLKEVETVKRRIENIYPSVKVEYIISHIDRERAIHHFFILKIYDQNTKTFL